MICDSTSPTCPHCHQSLSRVVETRGHKHVIYRRRLCRACKERFTTCESVFGVVGIKAAIKMTETQ